jgi:ABC-type branched-subunit amino acid transport system substrate-binding protein
MKTTSKIFVLFCLTLFTISFAGSLQAQDQTEEKETYAKTPPEYFPYSRFENPYTIFFLDTLEYTGYGRHLPEPDVDTVKIGFIGPIVRTVSESAGGEQNFNYNVGQRSVRWDGFYASHLADIGIKMLQGARLAVDHANAAGGFDGKPYKLIVKNDNGAWRSSGAAVIDLAYKDSVWAILGTVDGANSHILIRVALKAELPVMNTADTDPTFIETNIPWVIRNITDDRQMSYLLADFAYKKLGLRRVAAIRAANRYGRMSIDEFRDASTRLGYPFLAEMQYQDGDTLFTRQLERIKSLNVDGVITYGNSRESALILRQMREMGMDQWFFGSDRMVTDEFLRLAGDNIGKVAAGYPYDPTSEDPDYIQFKQRFQDRYNEKPEAYAAHAYDGINMIIKAIEQEGLNRARIRDAMSRMTNYRGVTGEKQLDAIFSNRSEAILALYENGAFQFYTREEILGDTVQLGGK